MSYTVYEDYFFNVYYSQTPDPRLIADKGAQISWGDMHANSIKFLSCLEKAGVLRISLKNKKTLARIFHIPVDDLTKEDYQLFCDIIKKAEINPDAKESTLRLLGDEFADRSLGDQFTLPIIKKLSKCGIPWHTCLSNHTMSLIRCYENNWEFSGTDVKGEEATQSIMALQKCIQKGLITREKVDKTIKKYLLPLLKVADYTINENQKITHYLHGRFGDNHIDGIAHELNVFYDRTSTQTEKKCLDEMQKVFQEEYVNKGRISKIVNNGTVIYDSIWNRELENTVRSANTRYVHGHDMAENETGLNVIKMDNEVGRHPLIDSFEKLAIHETLYSHESQEFKNSFLDEIKSIKLTTKIEQFFGRNNINFLIQPHNIYSRFQIAFLKKFLCEEDSYQFWNKICSPVDKETFLGRLKKDYVIWDVMCLLDKNNLLTKETFNLLLKNKNNMELIFQILLLLNEYRLLSAENKNNNININTILNTILRKTELDLILEYCIEAKQFSNELTLDMLDDLITTLNQENYSCALYAIDVQMRKMRCLNTFYILVPFLTSEIQNEISDFVFDENKFPESLESQTDQIFFEIVNYYNKFLISRDEFQQDEQKNVKEFDEDNEELKQLKKIFYENKLEVNDEKTTSKINSKLIEILKSGDDETISYLKTILELTKEVNGQLGKYFVDDLLSLQDNKAKFSLNCLHTLFQKLKTYKLLDEENVAFIQMHSEVVNILSQFIEVTSAYHHFDSRIWDALKRNINSQCGKSQIELLYDNYLSMQLRTDFKTRPETIIKIMAKDIEKSNPKLNSHSLFSKSATQAKAETDQKLNKKGHLELESRLNKC